MPIDMLCSASIQVTKWKVRSLLQDGPRKKSGPAAITAAIKIIAGPTKPTGRGRKRIGLLDSLCSCGLLINQCPSLCDALEPHAHHIGVALDRRAQSPTHLHSAGSGVSLFVNVDIDCCID